MASEPQSGADILVQCLVNHGVDVVFAYPGGASMPIHQALTRFSTKLRTILPRHEQGGGFMAESPPDSGRFQGALALKAISGKDLTVLE